MSESFQMTGLSPSQCPQGQRLSSLHPSSFVGWVSVAGGGEVTAMEQDKVGKAIKPNCWGPSGTGVREGSRGGQAQLQQGKDAGGQPSAVCPDVASVAGGSTDEDGGDCLPSSWSSPQ